jgi:hypothetical protein
LLFPTHAQFGRHTVFCMSDSDYPRAFVSFPRIAGSGNEIALQKQKLLQTRPQGQAQPRTQGITFAHPLLQARVFPCEISHRSGE